MPIRNEQPIRFNPRSVVDALDGGQVPPGGCLALTDLIFDQSNPFTLTCRPAAVEEYDFASVPGAGVVSVAYVAGTVCYGMIESSTVSGNDLPFAYDLLAGSLLTVTGTFDATTTPTTPSTTGDWTPPTMSLVGVNLYVTHPGFPGGGDAFFGWFDITDPLNPVWNSGNTGINLLPTVPTAVSQFNNRAWFVCGSAIYFTDALSTDISDATHIITIGDSIDITALAQQPLVTSVQGIIQSLVAFKPNAIAIITGDAADGTLAINIITTTTGTRAPRSIAQCPDGLRFIANDGIRIITHDGTLGPINQDLRIPFTNALNPSRASAAYNNNIYRVSVINGSVNGAPYQEYWLDLSQNGWTGPHTMIQNMATQYQSTFVIFNNDIAPSLMISDVNQTGNSTFVENGEDMSFLIQTSPLPDDGGIYENSATLSVIDMQVPTNGYIYTFVASDVSHGVLSQTTITAPTSGSYWGTLIWGQGLWLARSYGLDRYNIPWKNPLTFSRMVFQATGRSSIGFKIGKLTIGYQRLNFVSAV